MSIEDPVEIKQEDMLQLQLNEAIGLTYNLINCLSDIAWTSWLSVKFRTVRRRVQLSVSQFDRCDCLFNHSCQKYPRCLWAPSGLGVTEEELAVVLQGVCYQRLIGGGGILDLQTKTIKNTSQLAGMSELTSFLKMDISQVFRLKRKN